MDEIGKMLLWLGIVLIGLGGLLILASRVSWLGRLPGDIVFQSENFSCMFPLATSILLSLVLTIILNLLLRILNK
jgi:hypothetical protein